MKNKKGPLGTPLGNPLKYFNDQKIPKADKGIIINPPTGPIDNPALVRSLPPATKRMKRKNKNQLN